MAVEFLFWSMSDISNILLFLFYRCALYLLRFLVALVVILMYIGSGVAIYFTVDWITECPSVESISDVDEGYHITIPIVNNVCSRIVNS